MKAIEKNESNFYRSYAKYLESRYDTKKHRSLPDNINKRTDGLDFSSNDYLNLSENNKIIKSAYHAGKKYGAGATGSRLLSGNYKLIQSFERRIAKDKKTNAALVFNSGFQTNITTLSSLLDSKTLKNRPLVFFDRLNHASLYQAVFLSKAELIRYKHADMQNLQQSLSIYNNSNRPKFIVTETVFGMDGDTAPLSDIVSLAQQHNALLYLDEAHATGVLGESGFGLTATLPLHNVDHVIMGSFSKALGCSGGYIACSKLIREYIINHAAGFVYSTANSPLVIGASYAAWRLIPKLDEKRNHLQKIAKYFKEKLKDNQLNAGQSDTNIIPIFIGDEQDTLMATKKLRQKNIMVSCVRPPTVPPKTSRLRIALRASHTKSDIDYLIEQLKSL